MGEPVIEAEDGPGLIVHSFFVIGVDQEGEGGSGRPRRRLDCVGEEALVVVGVEVAEILTGVLRMCFRS